MASSVECDVDATYYPHLLLIPAVSFSIALFYHCKFCFMLSPGLEFCTLETQSEGFN